MKAMEQAETQIVTDRNVLVMLPGLQKALADFCGETIDTRLGATLGNLTDKTVYLTGDIAAAELHKELATSKRIFVIRELAENVGQSNWPVVSLGLVPILVHGVGVFYRHFFDSSLDHFEAITGEHTFQSLTESTKPGVAHRTGIYLTPVQRIGEELRFRLLRCSSNLSGPTGNFRAHDRYIVDALQRECNWIFRGHAELNHVLAQVYHNRPATSAMKQMKAKIKSHSDKTKDMPTDGLMAFCTFYDQLDQLEPIGAFDYGHKGVSALTRLSFRLKKCVEEREPSKLPSQFSITLYPNSVFFLPLWANRLYTHEIRSSMLDADKLPTRLGYVVRCSSQMATHRDGQTYLETSAGWSKLERPTIEGMDELRTLYAAENKTDDLIEYGDRFAFSMNEGDYLAPIYKMDDEFRCYLLDCPSNTFSDLMGSVQFEELGKGRQGGILVSPSERGVPLVRTTSKFRVAARTFGPLHTDLAAVISQRASLGMPLNNALIENYTDAYAKMGFHSDQALDLEDDSYIALFSCYEDGHPERASRLLVVEAKDGSAEPVQIPLGQHSVVVFSTQANRQYRHKIVLDKSKQHPGNRWLGITFRTSKTFVSWAGGEVYLEGGKPLKLASEEQAREFYKLRGCENRQTKFTYPPIDYTISESDLMPPTRCQA